MKLYCMSGQPSRPCNVIYFKGITIMLDCGLDMSSLMDFLPLPLVHSARLYSLPMWTPREVPNMQLEGEIRECSGRLFVDSFPEFIPPQTGLVNYKDIDVILISNYHNLSALPFITERTGFRGIVYATEPTLNIGRQMLEELVHFVERAPRTKEATVWKQPDTYRLIPPPLGGGTAASRRTWKRLYSMKELNDSLARVHMIGFSEKKDIFGALKITAVSSGYCLGSCNYIIQSDYEKIAYVSKSSTLTTHPKPMDQTALKNVDVLLLTSLTQTPTYNPDAMLGEFCMTVALTLRNNGNVLIPVYPSGVTYDLFECLAGHLESSSLANIPMYFISPVADQSLAYSNILAEWLSHSKQNKVYLPEEPFPHAYLVKSGRLKNFANIHSEEFNTEFRSPSVVFTGHPSLRFGDVVHFMELWGGSSQNTIIFTEPDFQYIDALAPYQPLAMKAMYYPIDTGLNFVQTNKLTRDLKPTHLVTPESYLQPPILYPNRQDLVIDLEQPIITYKQGDIINLPKKRAYEKIEMHSELAAELQPFEVRSGVAVATLTSQLISKDNRYILRRNPEKSPPSKVPKCEEEIRKFPSCYTWGKPDVFELIKSLEKRGIKDIKKEETAEGLIIHLQSDDTLIQVEDNSTHIVCKDQKLRRFLRDSILESLNKF